VRRSRRAVVQKATGGSLLHNVDGLLLCWNSLLVQPGTKADLKN
jgi:hypothetical protein